MSTAPKHALGLYPKLPMLIRKIMGEHLSVPIKFVPGNKCVAAGDCGYYTTPSGKTVVRYPNAYGYKTVYQPSTRAIECGTDYAALIYRRYITPPNGVRVTARRDGLLVQMRRHGAIMPASTLTHRDYRRRMRRALAEKWKILHPKRKAQQ